MALEKSYGLGQGWPAASGVPSSVPFTPRHLPVNNNIYEWDPRRTDLITTETGNLITSFKSTGVRANAATQTSGAATRPLYTPPSGSDPGYISFGGATSMYLNFPHNSNSWQENRWAAVVVRGMWSAIPVNSLLPLFFANGSANDVLQRQPMISILVRAGTTTPISYVIFSTISTPNTVGDTTAVPDNTWTSILWYRREGVTYLRVNGVLVGTSNTPLALTEPTKSSSSFLGGFSTSTTTVPWDLDYAVLGQQELTEDMADQVDVFLTGRRGIALPAAHIQTATVAREGLQSVTRTKMYDSSSLPAWSIAHQGEPLNLAQFGSTPTLDIPMDGSRPLLNPQTQVGYQHLYANGHEGYNSGTGPHKDATVYSDNPSDGTVQKFQNNSLFLGLHHNTTSFGGTWYAGAVQTVNWQGHGFAQKYGMWECDWLVPATDPEADPELWPAFWLRSQTYSQDGSSPYTEIDITEGYSRSGHQIHSTTWIHAARIYSVAGEPSSNPSLSSLGSVNSNLGDGTTPNALGAKVGLTNTFGTRMTWQGIIDPDNGIIIGINGIEVCRSPMLNMWRTPLYALIGSQVNRDSKASNDATPVTNLGLKEYPITVYGLRCWQNPAWVGRS